MKSVEKLFFLCFLFEAVLCRDFSIDLPERIEALRGTCVLIPCSFDIREQYDNNLWGSVSGLWYRDGLKDENKVFSSTATEGNKIEGKITGDLLMKNCTTIFYNIKQTDSGDYYFKLVAQGPLKYNYGPSVSINVRASPPRPSITLYKEDQGEVEGQNEVVEGRSVSLICSARALCSSNPPIFTWSFIPEEKSQEQNQNSSFSSSKLNFRASHLHHGLDVTCSATYRLHSGTTSAQSSLMLQVLYAPQISLSSSCNNSQESIDCFCEIHGNPSPTLEWFQTGQKIPSSQIMQSEINMGFRSFISIPQSHRSFLPSLQCVAANQLGVSTQHFSFMSETQSSAAAHNPVGVLYLVLLFCLVLLLSGAVIGFLIYRLKQLSAKLKVLDKEGTYASLQLSAIQNSDYETVGTRKGRR